MNNQKKQQNEPSVQLVGQSGAIQQVLELVNKVAQTDSVVLINGKSGTGKEVVARQIHYLSKRANAPFIPVNCAAIPKELLESELFGHEKGAFTGALSTRVGRFEMASGGTLFLDEIGDMPLDMQVKLLRVLQERVFERVGGNRSIKMNVRVIAATHQNLTQAIEQNKFREDLFYRLNVFPIEMPTLAQRTQDLSILVEDLLAKLSVDPTQKIMFKPEAMQALYQYDWPGNVRELSNLIERICVLHPGKTIGLQDLPEPFCNTTASVSTQNDTDQTISTKALITEGFNLKRYLVDLELTFIKEALKEEAGVVAHAAKRLGLRRTTLVEKMRKYNIDKVTTKS